MTLADDLATTCVAAFAKRATDNVRAQFEAAATREQLLRRHAERLNELAAARAADEDTTPSGYVETAAKRLVPMPHTLGEAAVRLPAMLAGGAYGHYVARPYEAPSADVIHKVLAGQTEAERKLKTAPAATGAAAARQTTLGRRLNEYLTEHKKSLSSGTPDELVRWLSAQRPEHVEGALKVLPVFGRAKSKAIRSKLVGALGEEGLPFLRREIGLLGEPEVKTLAGRLGRLRWGGAGAGALAAGVLAGIPFAARALYQKRRGGEAAVRAQAEAQQAIEDANREAGKREELLQGLERPNQGSVRVKGESAIKAGMFTGTPFFIWGAALHKKRRDDEAAARAQAEAQQALEEASREYGKREGLLSELERPNQGSVSEQP